MERHWSDLENKNDKKSNIIITSLMLLVLVLGVGRVIIANASVEASEKLRNLDRKIAVLEGDNQLLAEKIRVKESLVTLSAKANSVGFTKTNKYSFVKAPNLVAKIDEFFR